MPPVTPDRISLPDRYRVVRHLANGGMASVWEAHDELLDRDVAVKLLASHLGEDERARRRFQREARAAAGLSSHPHVVTIYDVGEHRNRVFMVMEIMRGGSVGDRLKSGREVSQATVVRWLREAAGALDTAHEAGVVHRDIKPGNLLLDDHERLAVADFGIARVAWEDQLTLTGQVLGTAAYLSPEQALGEPATSASDRYALAVVAYELLTGSRPFEAEHFAAQARAHVEDPVPPASTRAPELSRAVDAVLERGLAKEPGDRWKTSAEFVAELDRTLTNEPTGPTQALKGRRRLGRGAAGAGAAAAASRDEDGRGATPAGGNPAPARDDGAGRGRDSAPAARGGGRRGTTTGRRPVAEPAPRRSAAPLLVGLVALVILAGAGAFALANRGGSDPPTPSHSPRAQHTPKPKATATADKTEKPKATPTEAPTDSPTPAPTDTPTPQPTDTPQNTGGAPDLKQATKLQLEGYNARRAGDYQTALAKAQQAEQACGGAHELSPCGYALFEQGLALTALGQPQAAIPILQRRLDEYGDNDSHEVSKALKEAQKKAGKRQ